MGWIVLALVLLLPGIAEAGKAQGAFWRSLLVPGWGSSTPVVAAVASWPLSWRFGGAIGALSGWARCAAISTGHMRRNARGAARGQGARLFRRLGVLCESAGAQPVRPLRGRAGGRALSGRNGLFLGMGSRRVALALPRVAQCEPVRAAAGALCNGIGGRQSSRVRHPRGAGGQRRASSDRLRAQGGGGA